MLNTAKIKKDFQMLSHHADLVYLDNAATTLTPDVVVDAVSGYYHHYNANIHRGGHGIAMTATENYEQVRKDVAAFVHAPSAEHIVFTSGVTHGLNMLAQCLKHLLKPGDVILLTRMEHHANLLPWQRVVRETGAELRFVELTDDFQFDFNSFDRLLDERVKIVSVTHISNVLGTVVPIKDICKKAKEMHAITIVDAAQSVAHMKVDVQDIGCDALVFSAHKMYGPTGVGVLYGTKNLLNQLEPYHVGGGMISHARYEDVEWGSIPARFERGTPHIAGVIGLGAALSYVKSIGLEEIKTFEKELGDYAVRELENVDRLQIIGSTDSSVISFVLEGVHHYDIATLLDTHGIAVRAGHHCAEPLMQHLSIVGTCRISFAMYNTKKDIDTFVHALKSVIAKLV